MKYLSLMMLILTTVAVFGQDRMREIQFEGVECDSYSVYIAQIADTSGNPTVEYTQHHDIPNLGANITHVDSFLVPTSPKWVSFGVRAFVPDSTQAGKLYSALAVTPFVRADTLEIPSNFVILYNINNTFILENGKLIPVGN